MSLSGQKILVTGATGFIGLHLCRRLRALGAEVHGVSRRTLEAGTEGVHWWRADLADDAATERIVSAVRPVAILHLASEVVGARGRDLVLPTLRANLLSTVNVLQAAAATGCKRVVVTGSVEEPDLGDPGAVPSSPYAAAKWSATAYARMFHALYGLDVVILRVFMVYGPGQADVKKLVPYVTLSLLRGESPALSSGVRPVDWIYVDDVVDAFVASLLAREAGGKVLEVGSGELATVRSVVERLAALVRPEAALRFGAVADRPLERVRAADVAPTEKALGWKSTTPLDRGLELTVDWYRRREGSGQP